MSQIKKWLKGRKQRAGKNGQFAAQKAADSKAP